VAGSLHNTGVEGEDGVRTTCPGCSASLSDGDAEGTSTDKRIKSPLVRDTVANGAEDKARTLFGEGGQAVGW